MKKTLIFSLGLCLALCGCGWFKKVEVGACVSKEENATGGKKESVSINFSFTLSSATEKLHKALGELELALAETNANHASVLQISNEIWREYYELVEENDPLPPAKTFLQVWAVVRPPNGEKGTALEKLEQRVQFDEVSTNLSFCTFNQVFEETCQRKNKPEEWRAARKAKMDALVASTHKVKRIVADIETLAPEVAKESSSRPKVRNPLIRLKNKGDFLTGLVTVTPKNSLLEELFQVTKKWRSEPERPNIKLSVHELSLTELAKELQEETSKN